MPTYLAHIAEDGREQTLSDHLRGTAELSASFAASFGAGEFGYYIGLEHDRGKACDAFARRLRGGPRVDHASAGAVVCARRKLWLGSACIAGHHGGLPEFGNVRDSATDPTLIGRIKKNMETAGTIPDTVSPASVPTAEPYGPYDPDTLPASFWCRMLYSCLVDADYLDTEVFMLGHPAGRGEHDDIQTLLTRLETHIRKWQDPQTPLDRIRCDILQRCIAAGESERGLFTLTVPTGGGKTVASLAFALHHARKHGMKRVIYVIPYTSIIEQNAAVFRDILGDENVIEHHSEAVLPAGEDLRTAECRRALATENWDAPVIVTTAVQFFESMYADKPSKCRKLHNIADSVIIFDEAQMLPSGHLRPCVAAIANLVARFRATAVLCSATQPVLNDLFEEYAPGYPLTPIYEHTVPLYEALRRVTCRKLHDRLSSSELAEHLAAETQVLCVLNTRKAVQEVYRYLPEEGRYHLSTLMYPAHRKAVLAEIRARLSAGLPCRVVSTSLIEAGVDVDFPSVYRELAGLDSIVQAAGRCNREGKRPAQTSMVTVFECEGQSLPSLLGINIGAAREVMCCFEDLFSPDAIEGYFRAYRSLLGNHIDKASIIRHLSEGKAGCRLPFQTVAADFHLIDHNTQTVYIPQPSNERVTRALEAVIAGRGHRGDHRLLGPYSVAVYEKHYMALLEAGDILPIDEGSAYLVNPALYDTASGLSLQVERGKAQFI